MFLCVIDNNEEVIEATGPTLCIAYDNASRDMTTVHGPQDAEFYECNLLKVSHEIKFTEQGKA